VSYAKEKLAYEAGKSYEGTWKDHVIGSKTGGVKGMQALLGTQFLLTKGVYQARLQERVTVGTDLQKCDIAKCQAFCTSACESQCESLDSNEEAFLGEISWTKEMCDVEGSKKMISDDCEAIKAASEGCDANCGGGHRQSNFDILLIGLLLAWCAASHR